MGSVEFGEAYHALLNDPSECGDVGFIKYFDGYCLAGLIDGLGHGRAARQAALLAKDYVFENHRLSPAELIKGIHEYIKATRGAVAAVCLLDMDSGRLVYSGMGNIAVKLIGNDTATFVPKDGVIGYTISTPVEKEFTMAMGDILLFHSDGVKLRLEQDDREEWRKISARQIAQEIVSKYRIASDDASCMILKYS